jgi:phage tail-like protein
MRAAVPGLGHPHPLGLSLPALFQEDDFAQRLCAALDEVTAPVISTLDCIDAYFDPFLAPDDFLAWLSGWVAVALDEAWTEERRRLLVSTAWTCTGPRARWPGSATRSACTPGWSPR